MVRLLARGAGEHRAKRDMRGVWLVTLSLMVCVVGITNAMLMSVTERFREIGTMKCLGALDKFVVKLFLIESSLQGVAGSLAGALIGFLLAFVRALFTFHVQDLETGQGYWLSLRFFPVLSALLWFMIALGVGVVLSVVAAIYPAIRAARMEPVQAMRVEA
jgi:ABC-type lipoprotein release transport system permease subunit